MSANACNNRFENNNLSYTKEQEDLANRILNDSDDYYKVLNVDSSAEEYEIRRAYKDISKRLHPDKNHAPNAAEAFKVINNAHETLTNYEKRQEYDYEQREKDFERNRNTCDDNWTEDDFSNANNRNLIKIHRKRQADARRTQQERDGCSVLLFFIILPALVVLFLIFLHIHEKSRHMPSTLDEPIPEVYPKNKRKNDQAYSFEVQVNTYESIANRESTKRVQNKFDSVA